MPIDIGRAMAAIREAEETALGQLGEHVVKLARAQAPVRKLGRERLGRLVPTTSPRGVVDPVRRIQRRGVPRQAFRVGTDRRLTPKRGFLSKLSIESHFFRARRGTGATPYYLRQGRTNRGVPRPTLHGFTLNEKLMQGLSARGRYEVRSGRAAVTFATFGKGKTQTGTAIEIGGRLKNSIEAEDIVERAHGRSVTISADPVDDNGHHYARYVEFPTSHNAAQPFLLPALKNTKRIVQRVFEGSMREAGLKK